MNNYNSRSFKNVNSETFVAEASDLGLAPGVEPHGPGRTFKMTSYLTNEVSTWQLTDGSEDEGDRSAWFYRASPVSIAEYPKLRNVKLVIFNF